jgi:hypothetical protein
MGVRDLADQLGLVRSPLVGPMAEDDLFQRLRTKYGERAAIRVERDVFQRMACLNIAASAFAGSVVLVLAAAVRELVAHVHPPLSYIGATLTLVAGGGLFHHNAQVRSDKLKEELKALGGQLLDPKPSDPPRPND